jgi:hypothetical protein
VKRIVKEDINQMVETYPDFPKTMFNVVHIHQNKLYGASEGSRIITVIDLEAKPSPTLIAKFYAHSEVNSIINLDDNTLLFGELGSITIVVIPTYKMISWIFGIYDPVI